MEMCPLEVLYIRQCPELAHLALTTFAWYKSESVLLPIVSFSAGEHAGV